MTASMPLAVAVDDAYTGGAEEFCRSFFHDSRVRKIVGSVVAGNRTVSGLPFDFRDDLMQETYLIIHGYANSGKITNPTGIYSLVYATACNCARTLRNQEFKNGANVVLPAGEADDDRQPHDMADENSSFDQGEAVDIIRARNMIASIIKDKKRTPMQTHPLVSSDKPTPHVVQPAKSKESQSARQLSPAQKELSDIIGSLGYKHEEFAADIGIGMSRLASYLYGRTITVPDDIMSRARALQKEAAPVVERWKEAYDKPMPEIIDGWEKDLGLEPGLSSNDDILAGILEVNPVTVYRWRKESTSPQMHSIAKMDGRIRVEVERLARRKKKQ